jgi:predicted DNA-binding WGR domain protein
MTARRVLPRELPAVVGFRSYARFVSRDPATNRERFYSLTWQPLLWGGCALVWTWGRLGKPGVCRVAEYPDRASAQVQVERLVRRRLHHRYELLDWQ